MLVNRNIEKFNVTRKVVEKDYLLKNLKVIARKVVETNNSLCFHLFCLDEITFYMNDSVKTCQKGSKMVYCNEFSLMFQQGTISNSDLSDTSIMHLNWGCLWWSS